MTLSFETFYKVFYKVLDSNNAIRYCELPNWAYSSTSLSAIIGAAGLANKV